MYRYLDHKHSRQARKPNHQDEWMPHEAKELDLTDIGDELDKLMKGWGDINLDDISDSEKRDLEKFDKAMKDIQKVVSSHQHRARRARRARLAHPKVRC